LQVDLVAVMRKYGVGRGEVQGLQEHSARFASMVAAFCERLGWYDLEALIVKYQASFPPIPQMVALLVPLVKECLCLC
jgi:DNA polymerase theta